MTVMSDVGLNTNHPGPKNQMQSRRLRIQLNPRAQQSQMAHVDPSSHHAYNLRY